MIATTSYNVLQQRGFREAKNATTTVEDTGCGQHSRSNTCNKKVKEIMKSTRWVELEILNFRK